MARSFVPAVDADADASELFAEFHVDEADDDDDAIDAYALLNVSPHETPTNAIRSRFHRLSLLMHPDRAGGKLSFPVVSDAHAMLRDAKSRNAYDALGASGVRSLHQLAHAAMLTSRAVQDLVVSGAIENELSRLQSVAAVRHRTELTLDLAAGVRRFLLATYCSAQIDQNHVVVGVQLADRVASRHGIVSHSHMYTKVSRRVSSRVVASFTATTVPSVELDAWRRFGEHVKAGIGATFSSVGGGGLWLSAQRNFSRFSVGALRWTLGPVPGVGVSFDHGAAVVPGVRSRGTKYSVSGKLGGSQSGGTEFSVRKRVSRSLTAFAEARVGLSEVVAECGAERAVGACVFSYALAVDYVRGPCLIVCIRRGSCRLQIPMSVRHWSVAAALVATPLAMLLAYRRWLLGADDAHLNADGKEYVRNRLMAEQQRQNLASLARRIRQREQDCNGLVIVDAVYGVLQEPDDGDNNNDVDDDEEVHLQQSAFESVRTMDAIDPLQCCVQSSSRLFLPATSKACLSGLFPLSSSADSQLFVRYRYRNVLHEHTVFDDESLSLPDPTHVVEC